MEATSAGSDGGVKNHLENALSNNELNTISQEVAFKINNYIDRTFEEYLTSKALHETSKSQIDNKIADSEAKITELTTKYDEASLKLNAAEIAVTELGRQVESLNGDLAKARDKICQLENEIISLKSSRDAAVDERNDLTRILERKNAEVERLIAAEASIAQRLKAAIDEKCEAFALNDEIHSKELSLQYREKRIEQERTLLNSQIAGLTEEVNRLTSELQTVRLNNTSRLVSLETQLTEKVEELNVANQTIAQLNDVVKNLNSRIESLAQRLREQREVENKMTENYMKELDAKTKLSELFKSMHDDAEAKTSELTEGVSELQKLLNEATEKYGELETRAKQTEMEHEEMIDKKNELIASLKAELDNANDLLKASNAQNLDMALSDIAPSAATASKLLKSGMSLTQVYSQLVKVTDELSQEKEENRQLKSTINTIVQELEEKAPSIQKLKGECQEALESNAALSQQIDSLLSECNGLRDECSESSKIAKHYSRENTKLKGELADLGRQVCFLLKEIEQSRGSTIPNGDHDSSHLSNTTNSDTSSSRLISKTLVTFSDIQELQMNNQKLLRLVRELTEKQEEIEKHRQQFESGELQDKIETLKNRVTELTDAQDRQTKMVNGLIRQRDMFKKLYHDIMKGKRHEMSTMLDTCESDTNESMETSPEKSKNVSATADTSTYEIKYKECEKHLELLKEEYKTYKEEKLTNEKMFLEQIDNMRQEISKLNVMNSKCASTTEYNNERLKILQTNITTYKKQIASLEEKNKAYSNTIAKQEVSLQLLRDEVLNAQGKLSAAEITVENLKMEVKLLKDAELRLQTEKDILNRERQGQAILLKNLELIKASLERVETDSRSKIESRLDEATRECAALRRRLQEEQDRFRELASHLERQTETMKTRMEEEKAAADILRTDITQLRQDLDTKNKHNEDLSKKLQMALSPNADGSFDFSKKIKELENKLMDRDGEIKSFQEQLNISKEHIKQYCDISECAEKELKNLNNEYTAYKAETEKKILDYSSNLQSLQDKCSELEAEMSLQSNGDPTATNLNLRTELLKSKEELKQALSQLESYQSELNSARIEVTKISQVAQAAEKKYSDEVVLHSNDIQILAQVKDELNRVQNEINELVALKNNALEKLDLERSSWVEREKIIIAENEQLLQRFKDINEQNALLHNQIQALGTQLSVSHASRNTSLSETMNESGNESINMSATEDETKSSEQLFQIVKYLRKEKDITMAKFDILQAETTRLKSQLEISEKKLDNAKLELAAEREKSEVKIVTVNKQSDILRKVETLNALADSNRILREERDSLKAHIDELTASSNALEEQLLPLQEKIADLSAKNETLQSENTSLKADSARWRTRVNALVERANKTSPEDWKRLQNERETLAKMLTAEKESCRKANEELNSVKLEKTKLEEQYSVLSRQHNTIAEENMKMKEELQVLKDDLSRLTEEIAKLKSEIAELTENNKKLTEEVSAKEASLNDIRNKEAQIKKIAKKYKGQYEELAKNVEEDKKKTEGEAAVAEATTIEAMKKLESQVTELQTQLDHEKANTEKVKQDLETLRTTNNEKEEKAKQVLKQAKNKIMQLNEAKDNLSRELSESQSKIEALEQSNRDEQDVRLAVIKSQYEGRVARLEKERGDAQEKAREVEALQQKISLLQRQLATQATASKQQTSTEKSTTDPPTANIKPMAGVTQASVSGRSRSGEPPLASIRPMAQVGPTAPHDAHSTEYMPASSSRPGPRAALALAPSASSVSLSLAAPPESTQDMDTSEANMGSAASSDSTTQSTIHVQPPQQAVALVLPRVESASSLAVAPPPPLQPAPPGGASSGAGVSTSLAPETRPVKRRAATRGHVTPKRTRMQGFERSLEVEYQVPTSSRCDQEDEGVIVVDSEEDDERCSTMYREGEEEDEELDEEAEDEDEEEAEAAEEEEDDNDEHDHQQEVGEEEPSEAVGAVAAAPIPQIEAISSGTEPASGTLSLGGGGGDDGDDSIVPSTPTLYVPRRNDGFGEAVVSPLEGGGRFTFAETSHLATHPDLTAALPPPPTPPTHGQDAEGEVPGEVGPGGGSWGRGEEEPPAVSSQGGGGPHQAAPVAEEGREAEASASPAARRRPMRASHSPNPRWMSADSDSGMRGRGMRARGRPARRPHGYMRY